jgi:hypothetical protein
MHIFISSLFLASNIGCYKEPSAAMRGRPKFPGTWKGVLSLTIEWIQLLFVVSFATGCFFLMAILYRFGSLRWSGPRLHQELCQKAAVSPFPNWILVHALKRDLSASFHGSLAPDQDLWGSIHWSQSHRSGRACPERPRSRIPSPPKSLGRQTVFQLTKAWPRVLCSPASAAEMNLLAILMILWLVFINFKNISHKRLTMHELYFTHC